MINKITDGISVAINSEFGDDYDIHTESIKQGLEEPCFLILCINPSSKQFLGKRYFRTNKFCIHYFSGTGEPISECQAVAERLMNCLELITVDGDLIRGTSFHSEIDDGVLSFFVNYDLFIYKHGEASESMEAVEHRTNVKGF